MTNVLKIPANSQAYLIATRDVAQDKFDVRKFAYDYINAIALPAPWAYWKMNETIGTRIDSTGNGHDLSVHTASGLSYAAGKFGNCAVMVEPGVTGPQQLENLGTGMDQSGDKPFTMACWWKWHDDGGASGYPATVNSDAPIWWDIASGNCGVYCNTDDRYVEDYSTHAQDTWIHTIVVYDGSALNLYTNNVLKQSDAGGSGNDNDSFPLYVYSDGASVTFSLDELIFWDVALTEAQRNQLYNSGAGYEVPV